MKIFTHDVSRLYKFVCEDLRHIDTNILLVLCRARSDYNTSTSWVKELYLTFPSLIDDTLKLPWEDKLSTTITPDDIQSSVYPITLRKSTAPLSDLRKQQLRQKLSSPLSSYLTPQSEQFNVLNAKPYFRENSSTIMMSESSWTSYEPSVTTSTTSHSLNVYTGVVTNGSKQERNDSYDYDDENNARFRQQLVSNYPLAGGSPTSMCPSSS